MVNLKRDYGERGYRKTSEHRADAGESRKRKGHMARRKVTRTTFPRSPFSTLKFCPDFFLERGHLRFSDLLPDQRQHHAKFPIFRQQSSEEAADKVTYLRPENKDGWLEDVFGCPNWAAAVQSVGSTETKAQRSN